MPLWPARSYTVHLPPTYDGTTPHPVVLAFHGRGGNRKTVRLETCPGQNPKSRGCLDGVADCEGFIVVYPDGTYESPLTKNIRSFNAGGGINGYVCISGYACTQNIDDVRYVSDLLDSLETNYKIDPARVFVTGLSNGAALTHRLACELSHRIAAIAPIAGGNQYAAVDSCVPTRSVPVLEIHGTADPIAPFEGGVVSCDAPGTCGRRVSIPQTVSGWLSRDGCPSSPIVEDWADLSPDDGTTVTQMTYQGCSGSGDVVLLRVNGGGHTWPGGSSTVSTRVVGKVSKEFNANKVMIEFFKAHPMW
ncbi:MAG TPA: PHB depolymerase family esterase [Candidatus Polarisedimenticolia bacterium]|nr:PHB depolymerase family esterase [Candidatus Polarisedimenticolia bacterium]